MYKTAGPGTITNTNDASANSAKVWVSGIAAV
jgi:hypothetical protein